MFNGFANTNVGATPADVAGHRVVNIGLCGMWFAREERGSGHDLARLTVAAFDDFKRQLRFLNLVPDDVWLIASIVVIASSPILSTVVTQERVAIPLDGPYTRRTGLCRIRSVPVMPRTSRNPTQRRIAIDINAMLRTVDLDRESHVSLRAGIGEELPSFPAGRYSSTGMA